jgi:uncharacterized protein YndB with AHSA1/START domain
MLNKILLGLAVIIVGLVVVIAMQPAEFLVTRKATISAPPQALFARVNDLHQWKTWSPWGKLDPTMKETFEGAPAGAGAIYTWSGNKEVGAGRMTITESTPSELIRLKLEFLKPSEATCTSEFTFKPEGNQTTATWSMSGKNNFLSKAFSLFVSCDKMIGGDFERGLAQMKTAVETASNK